MLFYKFDLLDNFIQDNLIIQLKSEKKEISRILTLYDNKKSNLLAITDNMLEMTYGIEESKLDYFHEMIDSIKQSFENINDIAGVRVVCNYKDDIYKIVNIIRKQKSIQILKEKDYIKKPKDSGYSAYHMILEIPIEIKNEKIYVKVEVQIRTVLMDFWAITEHKVKYKPSKKISNIDSIKLCIYAKVVNMISDKMMKIYRK